MFCDKIKKVKIGRACSTYGEHERCIRHTGFEWGNLRAEDHLKYTGVDGRIILKRI
jgi:hypothetical protein